MGMFCGDGSCGTYDCPSGRKTSWAISNADVSMLLKYRKLCSEVYSEYTWVIMDTIDSSSVYKLVPTCGGILKLSVRYRSMMYKKQAKVIPHHIMNSNLETRRAFWNGLYDADGDKSCNSGRIDQKNQISIASFALLASSLGYSISFNTREDKPNIFRLNVTKAKQRKNTFAIKKKHYIEYTGYVYDLTTDNHHFQAGPGNMIVHNTDSCLVTNDNLSKNEMIDLSSRICVEITAQLPPPMALMFESYCNKALLFTKKRYVLVNDAKITYKGVMTARRDYCKYAKDLYKNIIEMIATGKKTDQILSYLDMHILRLVSGKCDMSDLVITKSLARDIRSYKVNQPHVVLARRLALETGIEVPAGTRLEYVFVKNGASLAEKMRTVEEVRS